MADCEHICGQLAARLYEPLDADTQTEVEAHLAACAACRAEADALARTVAMIPVRPAELGTDLLLRVRARIARPAPRRQSAWRWAAPLAAAAVVTLALAGIYHASQGAAPEAPVQVAQQEALSPALAEAQVFLERGQFNAAYQLLAEALATAPEDAAAGHVQLALAELEFSKFQQYDRAYAAYDALRTSYPEVFQANPETIRRYYLLEEARQHRFEPLYALDRARGSFDQLEEIVGRFPATLAAERAVHTMWRSAGTAQGTSLASLEAVRDRCRNPVAAAQVNMLLADRYWKEMNDPQRARLLLEETAQSEHLALAEAARQALSEMAAAAD